MYVKIFITFGQSSILPTGNCLFFSQFANLILPLTKKIISCLHTSVFIIQAPNVDVNTYKTYYLFRFFLVNSHFSFGQCIIWSIVMPPIKIKGLKFSTENNFEIVFYFAYQSSLGNGNGVSCLIFAS